jgi:hypothetical protein
MACAGNIWDVACSFSVDWTDVTVCAAGAAVAGSNGWGSALEKNKETVPGSWVGKKSKASLT